MHTQLGDLHEEWPGVHTIEPSVFEEVVEGDTNGEDK